MLDAPLDPSTGTTGSPLSDQTPAPKVAASTPDPAATSNPQTPIGATWGGVINVPNNFLGAGVAGKGWTITGESVVNGQRVVTLGRRVEQTGAFETHQIDGETFKAAKAYKDEQGGMSKNKKPPVLKEHELGRAVDPQGDIIPEFFDAATRSYRVRLPGGRTPEWIPESLILSVKQGKPDAIAKLRQAAKLDVDAATASQPTGAQLAQGVVASAVLGKSLATRLGLRQEKQESSPDRPSTDTTPASQKGKEKTSANRAEEEEKKKREALEGKDDAPEEEAEEETRGAVYRTNTYTATNKQGESAQVRSETPGAESTLRVATTAGTARFGTPLPITTAGAPSTETEGQTTTSEKTAANEPQEVIRRRAPKSRDRKKRGEEAKQAALNKGKETKEAFDPVKATLERSAARKAKKESQAVEQRFRSLSNNPEFKKLLFTDIDKVPKNAQEQVMKGAIAQWDEKQHQKKVDHIDKSYNALEVNPEFKQLAYQVGLEHLQNDPDGYFRKKVQGRSIALDRNGWVLDTKSGENLGHVLSIGLKNVGGLDTQHQIKQKALQAWHIRQAQHGQAPERRRAPRAVRAPEAIRKNAPSSRPRARAPISLDRLADITQTPGEQNDIRRMRELLRAQQGTRPNGAGQGALIGLDATLALQGGGPVEQEEQPDQNTTARLTIALRGLAREQALAQVAQAREAREAQVEGMRLWASSPDAQHETEETTSTEESTNAGEQPSSDAQSSLPIKPLSPVLTTHEPTTETEDTELAAQLINAEQELAHLNVLENALRQLPEGSTVPSTFAPNLSHATTPNEDLPTTLLTAKVSPTPVLPLSQATKGPSTAPSAEESNVAPTTRTETTTQKRATGIPSVNRLSRPNKPSGSFVSKLKNKTLPIAFASMASLGANQALDRGAEHDDPRQMMLNSDTSLPSESPQSLPQVSSTMTPSKPADTEEDVPRSTLEEAESTRSQSEQARANQEQFLGKQPTEEGQQPVPQTAQQTPEEGPLSPGQQVSAAAQMNAAQQQDKQAQKEQSPASKNQVQAEATTAPSKEGSPTARLTAMKMSWDVIEGLMDGVGFAEFLLDANTALVNDRYLHFKSLPSLKLPGTSERTQRYINYSVLILDALIAVFLFFCACLLVILIVTIICGTSPACVIIAAAT